MNAEESRIAHRLRDKAGKLLADLPERLTAAQQHEDEEAELFNRPAREIKIEPLIEVPTPILQCLLNDIGEKHLDSAVLGHVMSYRRHCKFMKGLGHTNVVAAQFI